jgi:putative chitinase
MCISKSVGAHGVNHRKDVKIVQILLNMNIDRLKPLAPLDVDGLIGNPTKSDTIAAIAEFQARIVKMAKPDRRVDPRGMTIDRLEEVLSGEFTEEIFQGILINAHDDDIETYFAPLKTKMALNKINTNLRIAHFIAQIGVESDDLRSAEEYASGAEYEGRADLGNTQKGDGVRFKGRGLIQLTGRANYQAYGDARNADYVTASNPALIAKDANLAVDVACWYWTEHDLNDSADADDIMGITHEINGGYNGLAERKENLARAKCFLGIT